VIGEKACTKCGVVKPLDAFYLARRNKAHGRMGRCIECGKLYARENADLVRTLAARTYQRNPAGIQARAVAWNAENTDRRKEIRAKWTAANNELMKEIRRAWVLANPDKVLAATRRRQLARTGAVPSWANRKEMRLFYAEARRLTKETGVMHSVDHIVPVVSELVCGLHCEANLQVMSHSANASKGNRWWPDMP
jgi:hypothetical protein